MCPQAAPVTSSLPRSYLSLAVFVQTNSGPAPTAGTAGQRLGGAHCGILGFNMAATKTFYLETFGCQMNVHDSEKVIGTLRHEGYQQVDTEIAADLILYNTCSIRDKAEQKVFNRLNDYKKLHASGKRFVVLGCVAQQEGERIFERAPYVSLVSGSASYRKLPEMLGRLEAGETRITGLDDRQTEETFETEFTARTNPYRGYITIIEGCDKFCAYCVVPFTRGRSGAGPPLPCWPRRARWPKRVTPRSSCWGRTSTPTTTAKGS